MSYTLVTGGAKGLGAELCHTLKKLGHNLLVHYYTSEKEAEAIGTAIQGDFSSQKGIEDFIERAKAYQITTLINNVGNYLIQSALETSIQDWRTLFETNFFAPLQLIQALKPKNIINIGVCGIQNGRTDTYSPAFTFTKEALWSLTRSLAKELASQKVRVNMVSPGYLENSVDMPGTFPMGRAARFEEVARVVTFLCDPASEYITGQNIEVAGGVRL